MSKVTAKYQITIPPEVRKELGIKPGMNIDIKKQGSNYVLLVKPFEKVRKKWRGRFKDHISSDEYLNTMRGQVS